MSSGKMLKILDPSVVRLKSDSASATTTVTGSTIADPVRFAAKKYYHNLVVKTGRNNETVIKESNHLTYGRNPPVLLLKKMIFKMILLLVDSDILIL
jgi:hypothetical protein